MTASTVGLLSLGGAALLAAFAPIGARGAGLVCVVLGAAMAAMWWLFATNDSSTSSLVFVWGWLGGVPAAATLGVLAARRRNVELGERDATLPRPGHRGRRRPA